jgi:hypothetical protein
MEVGDTGRDELPLIRSLVGEAPEKGLKVMPKDLLFPTGDVLLGR